MAELNGYLSRLKNIFLLLYIIDCLLIIVTQGLILYYPKYFSDLLDVIELFERNYSSEIPIYFLFCFLALEISSLFFLFKEKMLGVYLGLLGDGCYQLSCLIFDHVSISLPIESLLDDIASITFYVTLTIVSIKIALNKKFDLSKVNLKL